MNELMENRVDEYLPMVREHLTAALGKAGTSIDEYGPEKLYGEIHSQLPRSVRLVVRKQHFVSFCIQNQARLFESI